ncbi:hypothetical protein U14_02037 [Candidatus Moduliflexus flocculans]|uniref:Uncharacterized protein n=1 Tax=Candidatus Moduliflexus flocculans TaxID=1499966 RepID=A0A0S6VXX8_9BACT|nr:hypothetical protein U14_02037 [Candidatus Moduliflexus flocculans]
MFCFQTLSSLKSLEKQQRMGEENESRILVHSFPSPIRCHLSPDAAGQPFQIRAFRER